MQVKQSQKISYQKRTFDRSLGWDDPKNDCPGEVKVEENPFESSQNYSSNENSPLGMESSSKPKPGESLISRESTDQAKPIQSQNHDSGQNQANELVDNIQEGQGHRVIQKQIKWSSIRNQPLKVFTQQIEHGTNYQESSSLNSEEKPDSNQSDTYSRSENLALLEEWIKPSKEVLLQQEANTKKGKHKHKSNKNKGGKAFSEIQSQSKPTEELTQEHDEIQPNYPEDTLRHNKQNMSLKQYRQVIKQSGKDQIQKELKFFLNEKKMKEFDYKKERDFHDVAEERYTAIIEEDIRKYFHIEKRQIDCHLLRANQYHGTWFETVLDKWHIVIKQQFRQHKNIPHQQFLLITGRGNGSETKGKSLLRQIFLQWIGKLKNRGVKIRCISNKGWKKDWQYGYGSYWVTFFSTCK